MPASLRFVLPLVLAASSAAAQSWAPIGPPGGDVRALAVSPREPNVVYLGTAEGVLYRSDDRGSRWQRLHPGFPIAGMSLDNIVVTPEGEVLVGYWSVSGSGGGVATSRDRGRTFEIFPGIAGESVRALAISNAAPRRIVAGTLSGVFSSRDGGRSWERISPKDHADIRNIESVAFDPLDPNVIYAGTWHLPWKTTDGGRTWKLIASGMISDSDVFTLTFDAQNPRTLYATACSGIFRSLDAGARWARIRGIPSSSRRTRAFAQDPERAERLYAGTTEGLWVSEDGGSTWTLRTKTDVVVNSIVLLPGGSVLLGCDGIGVLRSDGEAPFTAANTGFSSRFVSHLLRDGANKRWLVALSGDRHHGGVLWAPQPEGPWSRLAPGLERREVVSLNVAADSVLAGTDDGLFVLPAGQTAWRRLPTLAAGSELHPRVAGALSPSPGVLLVATDKGLLRSSDGGRAWTVQPLGSARLVTALSELAEGLILAATPLAVYRSEDQGVTWRFHSDGPPMRSLSLVQSPRDRLLLLAGTAGGLYRSTDEGRTWSACWGLPQSDITGLAFHSDGRSVYAADFARGGLFRSDDTGVSWRAFSTDGLRPDRVWSVVVDDGEARLIAATASGGLHVYASDAASSR
jgi:photosystem II stability/assembly factor-like uncharacterized protein